MPTSGTGADRTHATFGRYAETPYDQMTPEQQQGYRVLAKAEGGELQGPAKIWVDNSKLAKAVAPLAEHFHPPNHSLTQREREIAVCVMLGMWHAPFPITAHNRVAINLAISPGVVDALLCGRPTFLDDQREQTVYELAAALAGGRYIPESLYERAVEVLGHDRITDITVLMGMYTAVSFTLKFYDVPADAPGIKR
ncbi:carboxymuconolactone decarboxylase [Mycobacterium sp. E2327]|uniref:carboxymuconolactone decarboxylase n=1 Tax=Mycobacterium sp. E2327 TaxID=1834132 RepID=UPI000A726D47|nr:carboxymuconolactone decarboxylase [Mycobacterium sp. E2327]